MFIKLFIYLSTNYIINQIIQNFKKIFLVIELCLYYFFLISIFLQYLRILLNVNCSDYLINFQIQ